VPITKRRTAPVQDKLTNSLDFLIRDTRLLLIKHIGRRIAALDVPLRAWFPLRVLYFCEGISQRELGVMLGYRDAHAGVIVRAMERRKLVERRPNASDRRRIDLYLSRDGKKVARQMHRLMGAINADIVAGLTAGEARSLHALLLRVHGNLAASRSAPRRQPQGVSS
jgi:MarR family transcriptional regulator, organic hydroperoxide resistance regulator